MDFYWFLKIHFLPTTFVCRRNFTSERRSLEKHCSLGCSISWKIIKYLIWGKFSNSFSHLMILRTMLFLSILGYSITVMKFNCYLTHVQTPIVQCLILEKWANKKKTGSTTPDRTLLIPRRSRAPQAGIAYCTAWCLI